MKSLLAICLIVIFTSCQKEADLTSIPESTVVDRQGNMYKTIQVEAQQWMAENLKVEVFNNGDTIVELVNSTAWSNVNTAARSTYGHSNVLVPTYGHLYNYYAVENDKLCPDGYHVPSKDEWKTFIDCLGGDFVAGAKLKRKDLWSSPNVDFATNESKFSAAPGGVRYENGEFYNITDFGYYWTSTSESDEKGTLVKLSYGSDGVVFNTAKKTTGASVRCIRN